MTILCSDVVGCGRISSDYRRNLVESSLYWRKQFRGVSADILNSEFRGRRSIW